MGTPWWRQLFHRNSSVVLVIWQKPAHITPTSNTILHDHDASMRSHRGVVEWGYVKGLMVSLLLCDGGRYLNYPLNTVNHHQGYRSHFHGCLPWTNLYRDHHHKLEYDGCTNEYPPKIMLMLKPTRLVSTYQSEKHMSTISRCYW